MKTIKILAASLALAAAAWTPAHAATTTSDQSFWSFLFDLQWDSIIWSD